MSDHAWACHHYQSVRIAGTETWHPLRLWRHGIVLCTSINLAAEREHNARMKEAAKAFFAAYPEGI